MDGAQRDSVDNSYGKRNLFGEGVNKVVTEELGREHAIVGIVGKRTRSIECCQNRQIFANREARPARHLGRGQGDARWPWLNLSDLFLATTRSRTARNAVDI